MSEQLNAVFLTGRPTREPEISRNSETPVAHISLAVNRRKNRDGVEEADFPRITLFGKNAEFAEKYIRKGKLITVTGRLQTGSYTNKDGEKVYTTDVIGDRVYVIEWPEDGQQSQQDQQGQYQQYAQQGQGWSYPPAAQYHPAQEPIQGMIPMPGEPYGRSNW